MHKGFVSSLGKSSSSYRMKPHQSVTPPPFSPLGIVISLKYSIPSQLVTLSSSCHFSHRCQKGTISNKFLHVQIRSENNEIRLRVKTCFGKIRILYLGHKCASLSFLEDIIYTKIVLRSWVTTDWVWFGDWICSTLTAHEYKYLHQFLDIYSPLIQYTRIFASTLHTWRSSSQERAMPLRKETHLT
jgi:hypothetical protein